MILYNSMRKHRPLFYALYFLTNKIMKNTTKFDFNDILINPERITDISSRYADINNRRNGMLPLMTAPMDTVVGLENVFDYLKHGVMVILPRTIKYEDYLKFRAKYKITHSENIFVSFGLNEIIDIIQNDQTIQYFNNQENILIDIANGHMRKIADVCKTIYKKRPDIKLIVGNIGNPEAILNFAECKNIFGVRLGIGNGNACLTTKNSGVGYPMASLIAETYICKEKYETMHNNKLPQIIADGGMRDYSDIIKAINLGADYVMLGSIFNKSLESSGYNYFRGIKVSQKIANFLYKHGFTINKHFRGMSTKKAQKAMGKKELKTSEGVVRYRKVEYTLKGWIDNFNHYLRNAMSYSNTKTLYDFTGKQNFNQITMMSYDRFNK